MPEKSIKQIEKEQLKRLKNKGINALRAKQLFL